MTEQMRQNDRVIRKTQREMDRERADLERQEKKLVSSNCSTNVEQFGMSVTNY